MTVSPAKTKRARVEETFEFLGIEFANGLLRPGKKSRERVVASISNVFLESIKAMRGYSQSKTIDERQSLVETMCRVSGIMQGWGKHYYFCNDGKCFTHLDGLIESRLKHYLGCYREERAKVDDAGRWMLLGIEALSKMDRQPFAWPKKNQAKTAHPPPTLEVAKVPEDLDAPPR